MENTHNHHKYMRLTRSTNEIRILELHPGKRSDPIRGMLHLASFGGSETYHALSYMWGDPNNRVEINVDGNEHFAVTRNAALALRDLRYENKPLGLWIDAIRINQADVKERNPQVRLMQQIYESASVVHVWLDVSVQDNHPFWQRLMQLDEQSTIDDFLDDQTFWKILDDIADNEYWYRVWIQQEVAFARTIIIHCRTHTIQGDPLVQFQRILHKKVMDSSTSQLDKRVHEDGPAWKFIRWVDLSGRYRESVRAEGIGSSKRYKNIPHALSHSMLFSASDARDKVYAILSLVDGTLVSDFGIHYSETVAEVYARVVSFVLDKYDSLGFLLLAQARATKRYAMPSWVPDWSVWAGPPVIEPSSLIMHCTNEQGPKYFPHISKDGLSLTAFGQHLDSPAFIHKIMSWQDNKMEPSLPRIWFMQLLPPGHRDWQNLESYSTSMDFDDIPEARWKAFLRTMTRAEMPEERGVYEKIWTLFKSGLSAALEEADTNDLSKRLTVNRRAGRGGETVKTPGADEETEEHFMDWLSPVIRLATKWYYLSVMKSKTYGLVPEGAQLGDEVWALVRCAKPMLLRPVDGRYEVIGPCYIDDDHVSQDLVDGLPETRGYRISEIFLR